MKYCLDASSLIALEYERYPREYFPTLYQRFEEHSLSDSIVVLQPIFDEVENYEIKVEQHQSERPIRYWITHELKLDIKSIDSAVDEKSLNLQEKYEIDVSKKKKSASEQDITLVAFASIHSLIVVSEEMQPKLPKETRNLKIPGICEKEGIRCINLLDFIKELDIRV